MSTPEVQPITDQVNRLQRWFQAVITHADGVDSGAGSEEAQRLIQLGPSQLEKVITRSRALTAAERLAIYANAYHTRLLECLGEVFPMKENESPPMPRAHQSFVAFSRRDFVVRRYNLSGTEFELLRAIQGGFPVGRAIERAARASSDSVDQLACNLKLWFRNWTAEGFFRGIRLSGDNTTTAKNNEHEH